MKTRLRFVSASRRYAIGDRELHCGDCFRLHTSGGKWVDTRIELASGDRWYLIGLSGFAEDYEGHLAELY